MKKIIKFLAILLASSFTVEAVEQLDVILKKNMQVLQRRIASQGEERDTIIVLGPTGSGKSTLVTLLGGGALRPVHRAGESSILEGQLGDEIHIGIGVGNGTTVPGSWYSPSLDVAFWDCPGFGDVGGPVKDISNAASIFKVLERARRTKILLVLEEPILQTNSYQVVSLFNQVADIFTNNHELHQMTSLVITKLNDGMNPLIQLKRYRDNGAIDFSERGRDLLRSLLGEDAQGNVNNRVSHMPKPTQGDQHYAFRSDTIWDKIQSTNFVSHPTSRITLTAASRDHVATLSRYLNREVTRILSENEASIIRSVEDDISVFQGNSDNLRQTVDVSLRDLNTLGLESVFDYASILAFRNTPGLSIEEKIFIESQIDQIRILRTIGVGFDGIAFDKSSWFGALRVPIQAIQGIRNSLTNPINKTLTPKLETFIYFDGQPKVQGMITEEDTFVLPKGVEKKTQRDLPGTCTLEYTHNDETLQSTSRNIYTTQDGRRVSGMEFPVLRYLDPGIVTMTIGSGGPNILRLDAEHNYERPDRSPFIKRETITFPIVIRPPDSWSLGHLQNTDTVTVRSAVDGLTALDVFTGKTLRKVSLSAASIQNQLAGEKRYPWPLEMTLDGDFNNAMYLRAPSFTIATRNLKTSGNIFSESILRLTVSNQTEISAKVGGAASLELQTNMLKVSGRENIPGAAGPAIIYRRNGNGFYSEGPVRLAVTGKIENNFGTIQGRSYQITAHELINRAGFITAIIPIENFIQVPGSQNIREDRENYSCMVDWWPGVYYTRAGHIRCQSCNDHIGPPGHNHPRIGTKPFDTSEIGVISPDGGRVSDLDSLFL